MSDAGRRSANGDERRRRTWSADQKQQIIAETFAPGASVAEVARRYGLNSNLLFTWRRREQAPDSASDAGEPVNIVPMRVVTDAAPPGLPAALGSTGRMEIVLLGGERIIVGPDVDATALARIIKALTRR